RRDSRTRFGPGPAGPDQAAPAPGTGSVGASGVGGASGAGADPPLATHVRRLTRNRIQWSRARYRNRTIAATVPMVISVFALDEVLERSAWSDWRSVVMPFSRSEIPVSFASALRADVAIRPATWSTAPLTRSALITSMIAASAS